MQGHNFQFSCTYRLIPFVLLTVSMPAIAIGAVMNMSSRSIVVICHLQTCLANQRDLGFAIRLYLQDHNDQFPVQYDHRSPDDVGRRDVGWLRYHMNGTVIARSPLSEGLIADAPHLLLLEDTGGGTTQICFLRPQRHPRNYEGGTGPIQGVYGPHGGDCNMLFADGHAATFRRAAPLRDIVILPQDVGEEP